MQHVAYRVFQTCLLAGVTKKEKQKREKNRIDQKIALQAPSSLDPSLQEHLCYPASGAPKAFPAWEKCGQSTFS